MEPYIDLFLARPIWLILGVAIIMGLGYFLTKDKTTTYSWQKSDTNWTEYVLGSAGLIYAVALIFKWGFFPLLYWLVVISIALIAGLVAYMLIRFTLFTEQVPRGDGKDDWMDPIRTRDKDVDLPAQIIMIGLGIVIFGAINLFGIHLAL